MAEKKLKASPSTSSSRRSTSPKSATASPNPAARQDRQARQERQEQNNATFARLFATLEGEQRKLKELEARRMKLTEEMRKLRALLLKENERLKIVVAPLTNPPVVASTSASAKPDALKKPPATPGVPQPTPSPAPNRTPTPNVPPPTPSPVVAPSPPPVLASNVRAMPSILKKTTSTVTAVVETGGPKAVAIGSRPRASSAGTLQRKAKASGRGMLKRRVNKVKNRRSPQNFENSKREELIPLDEDAPAMSSTLQTLENRRSYTNVEAPREDLDEVLVSLPALFTFIDAQLEQEPPLFEADAEGQKSPEDHYKPDAKSLLEELLGEQEAPPSTVVETQALNLVELAGISIESPEAEGMSIEATLGPEISIATQELVELSFERPASVDLWIEAPESAGISMIAEGLEVTKESKQQASEEVL